MTKGSGFMICSVVLTEEEDWIVARDVTTGIASQGKSNKEALDNLREALELYYEDVPIEARTNFPTMLTTLEVIA